MMLKRKAVLIFVLLLSFFSAHLWKQNLEQNWFDRKHIELDQEAKLLRVQIHNVFSSSFAELTSLSSLFKIHPQTSASEFNRFAKSIIEVHPEIKATQFANRETQIIYVYPVENNEITLEQPMILLQDPLRAALTRKAIKTRNLTVQDPFILRQGSMGTVVRLPVFNGDSLLGLVIGVYDIETLVKRVVPDNKSGLYSVRFIDDTGHIFYGLEKFPGHFVEGDVQVGGSVWNVAIGWKNKPVLPFYLRFGMFYLFNGCLILIVLFYINKAWLYNQFLQASIQKHTKSLQMTNASLKREVIKKEEMSNQLIASEEKYRKLIDSSIDGVVSFDSDLKILLWNSAAEKIYGYKTSEIIGESFLKLVPTSYRDIEKNRWIEFENTGQGQHIGKTLELLCLRKGGKELPVEISYSSSKMSQKFIATVIVRNITKRKENENNLLKSEKVLSQEVQRLRKKLDDKLDLLKTIGKGEQISKVVTQIDLVAPTDLSVIIQGESGTGKEVSANLIHQRSDRKDKPFIAVDCGAIPQSLFESELFGHEKGAFTGADSLKLGKFELAEGGTLFLDEITNLSLDGQAKLLRVIQEKMFYRVGGKDYINVDVRLIVATNRVISVCVKEGDFRDDLFHRLNQFYIVLPALRKRKDDIHFLVKQFIEEANSDLNKVVKTISPEAMKILLEYKWPGNIRELKNIIIKAVLLSNSEVLTPEVIELNSNFVGDEDYDEKLNKIVHEIIQGSISYQHASLDVVKRFEDKVLSAVLKEVDYNKSKAAKILNLNRKTLYNKLKKLEDRKDV